MLYRTRIAAAAAFAAVAVLTTAIQAVRPAHAAAPNGPTAVVSLGDSFVSGEGGRRIGNIWVTGTNDEAKEASVDRGWEVYYPTLNYPVDQPGGCHRSDVAEINGIPGVDVHKNLACSGASTFHLWPAADGGEPFKGEAPQIDQLRDVAQTTRVKAVVVAVGGNDMGFGDAVANCIGAYLQRLTCHKAQDAATKERIFEDRIRRVLRDVRATMTTLGYGTSDYQLIVQSYPTAIADSTHTMDGDRLLLGCPFTLEDTDWLVQRLFPRAEGMIQHAAHAEGARFLNLRSAFRGHELCAAGAGRSPSSGQPNDPDPQPAPIGQAEWINQAPWGQDPGVNRINESFHPNYYGQLVLQRCLELMYASTGDQACVNTPGSEGVKGTGGISLQPTGAPQGPDVIQENIWMQRGFCKSSADGFTNLCFEGDGNLRVYAGPNRVKVWETELRPDLGRELILQADGQLVIYGVGRRLARWTSPDSWGNPASYLRVDGQGKVRIYNAAGFATWTVGGLSVDNEYP